MTHPNALRALQQEMDAATARHRLKVPTMAKKSDIKMRGSGELLYQIKARALSGIDVTVFANLIWLANAKGEVSIDGFPATSVERLVALKFCARINRLTLLLNPHVAQLGNTPGERGQIRKKFRQLVGT